MNEPVRNGEYIAAQDIRKGDHIRETWQNTKDPDYGIVNHTTEFVARKDGLGYYLEPDTRTLVNRPEIEYPPGTLVQSMFGSFWMKTEEDRWASQFVVNLGFGYDGSVATLLDETVQRNLAAGDAKVVYAPEVSE